MSAIINGAGTNNACFIAVGFNQNDDCLQPPDYRSSLPQMRGNANLLNDTDVTWTRSSLLGSSGQDGITTGGGGILQWDSQRWEYNVDPHGNHTRKKVSGCIVPAPTSMS